MSHPSSSHEQTDAEALILVAVDDRLGTPVAPARVDLPSGSYVHVDGVSQEPILGELVDEACDEFGFTVWPATPPLWGHDPSE